MSHARFPGGRLAVVLLAVLAHLTAGCAMSSVGVRPDRGAYLDEATAQCALQHGPTSAEFKACLDYEQAVAEANGLIDAYESRAKLNEWALAAGVIIGLASVATLASLAVFGQAGSDAAKLIPIAGTFLGGAIAYGNSQPKADAYLEATERLRKALSRWSLNENGQLTRSTGTYLAAAGALRSEIPAVEAELSQKLREASNPDARKAAQLKESEKQVRRMRAALVRIESATRIAVAGGAMPTQAEIKLSSTIEQLKTDGFKEITVNIDNQPAKVSKKEDRTVTVEIPAGSRTAADHTVQVFLDEEEIPMLGVLKLP